MNVVLIGGHDRMIREYKNIGKKRGVSLKVFTHIKPSLEKCMGCPQAVIIFTSTSSHKMVKKAVCHAKKNNLPCFRSHNSSANSLNVMLDEIQGVV